MLLSDVVVVIMIIMYLGIVSACVEVHALCLWRPEEGIRSPTAGVTYGSEPLNMSIGTKLRSSRKAASALIHLPLFPVSLATF